MLSLPRRRPDLRRGQPQVLGADDDDVDEPPDSASTAAHPGAPSASPHAGGSGCAAAVVAAAPSAAVLTAPGKGLHEQQRPQGGEPRAPQHESQREAAAPAGDTHPKDQDEDHKLEQDTEPQGRR